MKDQEIDRLYQALGELVRLHRNRLHLTQEALGIQIGLSRTSVTNIEKGRQHLALHQFFALADALQVPPEALLPRASSRAVSSWVASKLPAGTEQSIAEWVDSLIEQDQR